MKKFNKINMLAIVSAITFSSTSMAAGTVVFAGVDAIDNSDTLYLGTVNAVNGNLDATGVLLRVLVAGGRYEYDTTAVAGGNVDADHLRVEAGAGYQWVMQQAKMSVYGSVDYQDHDLDPHDTHNDVRGSEAGASVRAEASSINSKVDLGIMTAYSTAFDTYWARGRAGYNFGSVTAGAELAAAGNEGYDEDRYGVYGKMPVSDTVNLELSVGHSDSDGDRSRSDESGAYLNAGFSLSF